MKDQFLIDFSILNNAYYLNITDTEYIAKNTFINSFSSGIENKFPIKNYFNLFLNFDFNAYCPFNDSYSFSLSPEINISGNYYFGLEWELKEYFIVKLYPVIGYFTFTPTTYINITYEFFRFFGSKNFKFKIITDDKFGSTIESTKYNEYLFNKFRFGILFNLNNFKQFVPSIYFIMDTYSKLNPTEVISNSVGFEFNLDINIYKFLFTLNYKGTIDAALDPNSSEKKWISIIDFYVLFFLSY